MRMVADRAHHVCSHWGCAHAASARLAAGRLPARVRARGTAVFRSALQPPPRALRRSRARRPRTPRRRLVRIVVSASFSALFRLGPVGTTLLRCTAGVLARAPRRLHNHPTHTVVPQVVTSRDIARLLSFGVAAPYFRWQSDRKLSGRELGGAAQVTSSPRPACACLHASGHAPLASSGCCVPRGVVALACTTLPDMYTGAASKLRMRAVRPVDVLTPR